jgi:hypothetical protein
MKHRDSIRLEWLQKHGALINRPDTLMGQAHICLHTAEQHRDLCVENIRHFYGRTYRQVIDKAMKEVQ